MAVRIAIEGNIAAGKSTFLQILAEAGLGFVCVPEPVNKWQSLPADDDGPQPLSASQEAGCNILDKFYSDQERWAFTFQTYAFLSRLRAQLLPFEELQDNPKLKATTSSSIRKRSAAQQEGGSADAEAKRGRDAHAASASTALTSAKPARAAAAVGVAAAADADDDRIIFFERSVLSDKYCFAANCRASGLFQEVEWRVYCDWWTFVMHEFRALRIDGLVYLRCTPATCHSRLKKRARSEEAGVPLDYLCDLHRRHEQWLIGRSYGQQFSIPTLVLNTDEEFETNPTRRASMVAKIKAFVRELAAANGATAAVGSGNGVATPAPADAAADGSSSSSSTAAAAADGAEAVLARRLSSGDGVELLGELTDVKMMRVGADGLVLLTEAEYEEDDVPSGPVVDTGAAPDAADAAAGAFALGSNATAADDDGDDGDGGDEGRADASATGPRSAKAGAVAARKESAKPTKGISAFFNKGK